MTNIDILKVKELCNKYISKGLSISIEFERFGMVISGSWDLSLSHYDIRHFKREYDYKLFENISQNITLEYLIDEFKKEFESRLKLAERI